MFAKLILNMVMPNTLGYLLFFKQTVFGYINFKIITIKHHSKTSEFVVQNYINFKTLEIKHHPKTIEFFLL